MHDQLLKFVSSLSFDSISEERRADLHQLSNYIKQKKSANEIVQLNFICTHNSRRSHLGQIWAQVAAYHYGVVHVFCYSGGTEATAMFPKIAETLTNTGFKITAEDNISNPKYAIQFATNAEPITAFSKVYDDEFNPKSNFAAIMTCDHADANCPFIPGAEARISLTYEDPKAFDNSPLQNEKYAERSKQIATELFYAFSIL